MSDKIVLRVIVIVPSIFKKQYFDKSYKKKKHFVFLSSLFNHFVAPQILGTGADPVLHYDYICEFF